jgi:hypothetical protein
MCSARNQARSGERHPLRTHQPFPRGLRADTLRAFALRCASVRPVSNSVQAPGDTPQKLPRVGSSPALPLFGDSAGCAREPTRLWQ